eukprot:3231892-Rhodomonas_salina.4
MEDERDMLDVGLSRQIRGRCLVVYHSRHGLVEMAGQNERRLTARCFDCAGQSGDVWRVLWFVFHDVRGPIASLRVRVTEHRRHFHQASI